MQYRYSRYSSRRAHIAAIRGELHAKNASIRQIAHVIRARLNVNSRVAYRYAHGLTQQQVADRWNDLWPSDDGETVISCKNISYWETWPGASGRSPTPEILNRLARIYRTAAEELLDGEDYTEDAGRSATPSPRYPALSATAHGDPAESPLVPFYSPPAEGEDRDMRRRRFMQTLTGIAMTASSSMVAVEALRQAIDHATGRDPDQWNQMVTDYGLALYTMPANEIIERLSVDTAVLGRLMAEHPDDPDLNRAAAGLATILAAALTSAGDSWTARRWWQTAHAAADRSGDLDMRIMTRQQEVIKGLYDGRPLDGVLRLADETIALAGSRVCRGTAGALAGRAQALASCGRRDEAIETIRAVEVITERMPASALADESLFGWPEHRLRHTQSYVFTEIGDTAPATAAQERALELYPDVHAGNRAMVQMHQASCLIREGHIGDGLGHATEVLDALPVEHHEELLYTVARRALTTVPAQERRRPEFTDLHDRLVTLPAR